MQVPLHAPDWPDGLRPDTAEFAELGQGAGGRRYARWPREGPWGPSLFAKAFTGGGACAAALREFRAGMRLLEAGVPAPRPWAVLTESERAWLLCEDLGSGRPLHASEVRADPGLLARVARAAAVLHRTGFVHGDMHLGNLLRDHQGRLHWTDLRRLQRPRRQVESRQLTDLGWLLASLDPIGTREALGFVRAWAEGCGRSDRPQALKALAHKVCREAGRRQRRHQRNLDRRARRDLLGPGVLLAGHPAIWRDDSLRDQRERLEDAAAHGTRLKDGDRSLVSRVGLPDGRTVVVKHFRPRRGADPRDRLGLSKGITGLLAAEALARRGFRAARPLAAWSRPGAGSWLVLEDLAGIPCLHEALAGLDGTGRRKLLRLLARTLRRLHEQGVAYRDLKPENVLVDGEAEGQARFVFLDHDRNRFRPEPLPPELARRDLAAVHAGLPPQVRASERLLALRCYDPRWLRRDWWRRHVRPLLAEAARRRHRWQPRRLLGGTP